LQVRGLDFTTGSCTTRINAAFPQASAVSSPFFRRMYASVQRAAWGAMDNSPNVCIDPDAASNQAGTSKETNMGSATFRMICRLLIASVMALSVQTARAGMIGADQVTSAAGAQSERNTVLSALSRPAVTSELQALGVDSQAARDRVAAMSDEELRALAGKMNSLPVGGEGLVVVVLLVLIVVLLFRR
jgi:hypothetical protein